MGEHIDYTHDASGEFLPLSQIISTLTSNSDYISSQSLAFHNRNGEILDAGMVNRHLQNDLNRLSAMQNIIAPYFAEVRQRIMYELCLLSPIRRVPLDILQLIFVACLPPGFVEAHSNQAPLILCQICHYWRDVALAMPVLWTSFRAIRYPDGFCKPALPLAQLWLSRSHPAPISICLPVDTVHRRSPQSYAVQQLVQLFFQHLSRWKTIHMCLEDLVCYVHEIPPSPTSPFLEELEICFPPSSSETYRLSSSAVPSLWSSSLLLHTLTLNATISENVMGILRTCLNIRDCEFHITDTHPITHAELHLPYLYTLTIRARTTAFHILRAITVPVLRKLTIHREQNWSQTTIEDLIQRSSCAIEEFSMVNVVIGPHDLLSTLERMSTSLKILRIDIYSEAGASIPISKDILLRISSRRLVPHLEVLGLGCNGMCAEPKLFKEMVLSRLASDDLGRPRLRQIWLSPGPTPYLHSESLAFVKALQGTKGLKAYDDDTWREYRIDDWYEGIRYVW